MLLLGCTDSPSNQTTNQPSNLTLVAGPCDENTIPYIKENLGIKDVTWLDDTTLKIKAIVSINCANTIGHGNYKTSIGNEGLFLEYKIIKPISGIVASCMCAHELNYTISDLEQKDYSIEIGPM